MASTLLGAALTQYTYGDRPLAIVKMFDQISPVLQVLPMKKIDGRLYEYGREIALPTTSWRGVNAVWAESTGVVNPYVEHTKILGGESKVDRYIMKTNPRGGLDEMVKQIRLRITSTKNEFERAFFEGSELINVDEMVGLRGRIGTGSQLILQAAGGGTLSLAKVDELLDSVPFGKKHLWMNRKLRRKLTSLVDASAGSRRIEETRDAFGRQNEYYAEAQIHVVETSGDGTSILGFDEQADTGSPVCASVYATAFGDELIHGFYSGSDGVVSYEEFGELEAQPVNMVRFESYVGIAVEHPRSVGRLYGVTDT